MNRFSLLPNELINIILSYDKHFRICKGNPISIIPKDDSRYGPLREMPIAKDGYVFIKKDYRTPIYLGVFTYNNMNDEKMFEWRMIVFHRAEGRQHYYTSRIK